MFSSVPLMSAFTVLFLVTAAYSIARLAALASGVLTRVDRAAELSHVLMSVAMIAMTWGWSGGPSSPSGVLQIAAFGLAGLYFAVGVGRGHRAPMNGVYHLVTALAMVWMVATMPLRTGTGGTSGAAMEGMPGMPAGGSGPSGPAGTGAHPWLPAVSLVFVALLIAATLYWAARVARRPAAREEARCAPGTEAVAGDVDGNGEAWGTAAASGTGEANGTGAVAVAAGSPRLGAPPKPVGPPQPFGSLLTPRADAVCHALMSAGMAGMLAAMI